jgi:hypothetical protein
MLMSWWRKKRAVRMLGELRPGATYLLRIKDEVMLEPNMRMEMARWLEDVSVDVGCRFVLLGPGVELAEPKEVEQ